VQPILVLAIPRAAVLSDQQGDYVYVVDVQKKAQQRRIQLGQSTPTTAVVTSGLKEGELVISEGLQRVRPGETVSPGPASPPPPIPSEAARGGASGAPADGTEPSSPASDPNPPPDGPPGGGANQ
jgi:membrane fusion protein, multidrug efflux system